MSRPTRSRPLIRYVVSAGARVLGTCTTLGYDRPTALVQASKRWHRPQAQLTAVPWEEAPTADRVAAIEAEIEEWYREGDRIDDRVDPLALRV